MAEQKATTHPSNVAMLYPGITKVKRVTLYAPLVLTGPSPLILDKCEQEYVPCSWSLQPYLMTENKTKKARRDLRRFGLTERRVGLTVSHASSVCREGMNVGGTAEASHIILEHEAWHTT